MRNLKTYKLFEDEESKEGVVEVQAPNPIPDEHSGKGKVFLAGSIEMGKAEDWQSKVKKIFKDKSVVILNPRRDDWDSSWKQEISDPQFREQVEWELRSMDNADVIIMYFDPATKSPISLLELGRYAQSGKLMVCCPEGFWRKGNVDIVCAKDGVQMFDTVEDLASAALTKLSTFM